jgi:TRAP transporter TAXI family solute receptor
MKDTMKLASILAWFLSLWFAFPCTAFAQDCKKSPDGLIRFATGHEKGGYWKVGDFVRALAREGRFGSNGIKQIALPPSTGSDRNIELLSRCEADLALVQSDIFHEASQGHGFDKFTKKIDLLAPRTYPLYAEFIQILVPPHSTIHKVKDLSGQTVLLGLHDSGTEHTAETILRTAGVQKFKPAYSEMYSDDALLAAHLKDGFKNREYAAAFFSTSTPNPVIEALIAEDPEYRLISLDNELIRELISEGAYIAASIPSATYWKHKWWQHSEHDEPVPPEDVATVGVEALLVSRKGYEEPAAQLAKMLKQQRSQFQKEESLDLDLIVPFLERQSTIWLLVLLVIAYVSVHLLIARYRRRLRVHQEVLVVVVFFISIWLLAAAGLWFFEHRYNPYFETYGKSCWSMLSYVAGRFEGRMPMTPQGEFLSVVSVIFGVGLVAWFTAELSGRLVKGELGVFSRILERRNSMLHLLSDHTVIFNWDSRVPQIIKQIRQKHAKPGCPPSVLVTPTEVHLPDEIAEFVIPLVGNSLDVELLEKARIAHAQSVVILSNWKSADANERRRLDADAADSKTMMTIMAIRNLHGANTHVRIVAEIREKCNLPAAQHCAGAHCEIDLICVQEFGAEMLAASAASPGVAALYSQLLNSTGAGTRINKVPIPKELVGKSFSDVLHWFVRPGTLDSGHGGIPIGIYRSARMYISPNDSHLGALLASDQLFLIGEQTTMHPKPPIALATGHARRSA